MRIYSGVQPVKTTVKPKKSRWFLVFWPGVVALSLLITFLVLKLNHDPVNVDGILYIEVIKLYTAQGLEAATALYPWPFYPVLLATLSQLFHVNLVNLDLLNLALWVNNIFVTITLIFWLAILKEFKVSRTVLLWGACLILLYPPLNHLRDFVIRGPGYWAFLFSGLWCLFQFIKSPCWQYTALYSLLLLIATLFRFEGAIIWCMAPIIFFFFKDLSLRQKTRYFLHHELLFFMVVFFVFFWKMSHPTQSISQLEEIHAFQTYFEEQSQLFALQFSSAFVGNFFVVFIKTITPLYLFLVIYGWIKHRLSPSPQRTLFFWLLFIQFCIPLGFYLQMGIITDRYLLPFCLTLSLLAPIAFSYLSRRFLLGVLIILAVMACDGIVRFGYSKAYLTEAGLWLKQHSQASDKIYSNSSEVLFYAENPTIDWQMTPSPAKISNPLQDSGWKSYNYLAIRLNGKDDNTLQQLEHQLSQQPIKTFRNKRDDKVVIFYVPH